MAGQAARAEFPSVTRKVNSIAYSIYADKKLPRGGQYSLKGKVINVPVDIQPSINCIPWPMDENFTVAIQLSKKLSYKKVDFKENVRPLKFCHPYIGL